MKYLIAFVYLTTCLLFPCALAANGDELSSKVVEENFRQFADNGFEPSIPGLRVEGAIEKENIIKRFGAPLQKKIWKEPDPREPMVVEEFASWEYAGLTITTVTPLPGKHTWIKDITLTSPDYALKYGLHVGMHVSKFIKTIGKPNDPYRPRKDEVLYYYLENSANMGGIMFLGHIHITLESDKNGAVRKIVWSYLSD